MRLFIVLKLIRIIIISHQFKFYNRKIKNGCVCNRFYCIISLNTSLSMNVSPVADLIVATKNTSLSIFVKSMFFPSNLLLTDQLNISLRSAPFKHLFNKIILIYVSTNKFQTEVSLILRDFITLYLNRCNCIIERLFIYNINFRNITSSIIIIADT